MRTLFRNLFCFVLVDFFYFSTVFTFSHGINTKLLLAIFGLLVFIITGLGRGSLKVTREIIVLSLLAAGVSLFSFASMAYNGTSDNSYCTYVLSMLVWLFAGYMVVYLLKKLYGNISIELLTDYIIVVSFFQCLIALLGSIFVPVNNFIKLLIPGTEWMDSVNRIYGLGDTTTLDTGGIRYAIACVFCAFMIIKRGSERSDLIPWYLFAFMFITVVGNMIARTTSVGSVIALLIIFAYIFFGTKISIIKLKTLVWMMVFLLVVVTAFSWLYNTNDIVYRNLRFGFEGFFSLVERGKWQVGSNDTLQSMYVLPDNPKTWLIGDGYFVNPRNDPNFLGEITIGYYKNTDIGYLRFIFYFGVFGLLVFSLMIIYAGKICCAYFPDYKPLFIILVLIHFIIWLKVATDCFFILGIFIAMGFLKEQYEQSPIPILSE